MIEKMTGIKRSPTQVREFMKKIGMKTRKIGYIPRKATNPDKIEEQEQFQTEILEPLLNEAKQGKRAVYFVDAAHFTELIWVFCGVFNVFLWLLHQGEKDLMS